MSAYIPHAKGRRVDSEELAGIMSLWDKLEANGDKREASTIISVRSGIARCTLIRWRRKYKKEAK